MSRSPKKVSISDWRQLGEKRVFFYLARIERTSLKKLLPRSPSLHVEVHFVSKLRMSELNLQFRKKPYPTDILSFSTTRFFRERGQLGELVICLPVLKAQAKAEKHSFFRELDVLVVHGLLHLLGLDHEVSEKEARKMAGWEKKILVHAGLIERATLGKTEVWKK